MAESTPQQKELREKYLAAIKRQWKKQPDDCPICGSNMWNIGDVVNVPLRDLNPMAALWEFEQQQKRVYVYVPVTCLQCGYTMFFHSGVLDIREKEEVPSVGPLRRPDAGK